MPYYYCCDKCGVSFETHLPIKSSQTICECCYFSIATAWQEIDDDDCVLDCTFDPTSNETVRKPRVVLPRHKFFLTFTKKPDSKPEEVFEQFKRFTKQAKPKFKKIYYVTEHEETNYHIHVYVECHYSLPKSYMKRFENHGKIDRQKAKGTLEDVLDYMSKEKEIIILLDL